jgi:hypothetical protein
VPQKRRKVLLTYLLTITLCSDDQPARWMKESEILEMFRLGIKYMDITDYQDAYDDIKVADSWKPCKYSGRLGKPGDTSVVYRVGDDELREDIASYSSECGNNTRWTSQLSLPKLVLLMRLSHLLAI